MNAGHSLGEWLAGYSSELAEANSVKALIDVLNPETFELKDSKFIAIGAGIDVNLLLLKFQTCIFPMITALIRSFFAEAMLHWMNWFRY
jgi:hypothetical protein